MTSAFNIPVLCISIYECDALFMIYLYLICINLYARGSTFPFGSLSGRVGPFKTVGPMPCQLAQPLFWFMLHFNNNNYNVCFNFQTDRMQYDYKYSVLCCPPNWSGI